MHGLQSGLKPKNKKPLAESVTGKLTFGYGNAKIVGAHTFGIPSGKTCPGARDCKATVVIKDGVKRLIDGPEQEFRCFAASLEVTFAPLYEMTQRNMRFLLEAHKHDPEDGMYELLKRDSPRDAEKIRVHTHGDFFNQHYFDAWLRLAQERPWTLMYAYTKSLPAWVARLESIPENFVLTASRGGKYDDMISTYKLREAIVVDHPIVAEVMGLEIDHDDSHAQRNDGKNFCLLIHGVQKAGSGASEAIKTLKEANIQFAYGRDKNTSSINNHSKR